MHQAITRLLFVIGFTVGMGGEGAPLPADYLKTRPKLVVVISVDQFRSDYLTRFSSRFLPNKKGKEIGGYSFLTGGAYFPDAKYQLLQNMTGPGHATILTGAYPSQGGIPVNSWFDVKTGQPVYCVEDGSTAWVGGPTPSPHVGSSPKNLIGTTVGDELKNAGFPSRVISIALKDRAAILLGGHRADLALWLDGEHFQWVSSQYYLPEGTLPAWVKEANLSLQAKKGQVMEWKASGTPTGYSTNNDFVQGGMSLFKEDFGKSFPHTYKAGSSESLATPFGLEITEAAAEKAIEAYGMGKGEGTDLLAVSFSSHDYAGHAFGPNSLEMEEMTVAEDRVLSRLFNFLNKSVPGGLKQTLIVLTADHGIVPNPTWLEKTGINAGRIDEKSLSEKVESALEQRFGHASTNWVAHVSDLNFYLNRTAVSERKAELAAVEVEAKTALLGAPGIAHVFTARQIQRGELPRTKWASQAEHSYFSGRSGDVVAVPLPFYFSGSSTVDHMTGYNYDASVPIAFAGPHIADGVFAGGFVVDIAPTLAFLLGVIPPSNSEGTVLSEIFSSRREVFSSARPARKMSPTVMAPKKGKRK